MNYINMKKETRRARATGEMGKEREAGASASAVWLLFGFSCSWWCIALFQTIN